jgi:hypothetical protein
MVKKQQWWISLVILCVLIPFCIFSQEVTVTAEIEKKGIPGKPLQGTITVTHERSTPVDEKSFILGSDNLEVEFVKEEKVSPASNLVNSVYHFNLKPKDPGLHELPEVIVTVGKRRYRSTSSTYEVDKDPTKPAAPTAKSGKSGTIPIHLGLEEIVEGETTLYPGQQVIVGYRFTYNFSVDLSKEELPLIKGEGLLKVGAKDTNQSKEGDINTFEVKQVLQAVKPGEYVFKPGSIEGRAYRVTRFGQKEIAPDDSRAESKGVTIHVLSFPEKGKPPSFSGAIGTDLEFKVTMLSSDKISVGDKISLLIEISGNGELHSLPMPEVCCQPGFSGFFKLSDLPPVEELISSKKTFKVEMRPLNESIKEIPSLEFSYFNPREKSYTTLKSKPIPIEVTSLKREPTEEPKQILEEKQAKPEAKAIEEETVKPELIEIEGNYLLNSSNLENLTLGTWKVLFIIPFGIAFLLLQLNMKKFMKTKQIEPVTKKSEDIFREAMEHDPESSAFFNLIQQAFLLRLVERGDIPSANISPDYLPIENEPGKVRTLMREIEEKRFAAVGGEFDEAFIRKIKHLFNAL